MAHTGANVNKNHTVDLASKADKNLDLTVKHATTQWPASNGPFQVPKPTKKGALVDGTVVGVRAHTIKEGSKYHRFQVVTVDVKKARPRVFDKFGVEQIPNASSSKKVHSGGWLNEKHNFASSGPDEDVISLDALRKIIVPDSDGALPPGYYDENLKNLHPQKKGRFEFWGDPEFMRGLDFAKGDDVRLAVYPGSVHLERIVKEKDSNQSRQLKNYTGENLGQAWADKMMSNYKPSSTTSLAEKPKASNTASVEEKEWED